MNGILLFSHGSLLCGAGLALNQHAQSLRQNPATPLVEIGYLNYSEPTFEQGVESLVHSGATLIVIVPFFLVPGYFVTKSLPERLEQIKTNYPNVEFKVSEPLGADDLLVDALIEAAANAIPLKSGVRLAYHEASEHCRIMPKCPIYGTEFCPTTFAPNEPIS